MTSLTSNRRFFCGRERAESSMSFRSARSASSDSTHSRFSYDIGDSTDDGGAGGDADERRQSVVDVDGDGSSDGDRTHTRRKRTPLRRLQIPSSSHGSHGKGVLHHLYRSTLGKPLTLVVVLVVGLILVSSSYSIGGPVMLQGPDVYDAAARSQHRGSSQREHDIPYDSHFRQRRDEADEWADFDNIAEDGGASRRRQASSSLNNDRDGDRSSRGSAMLLENDEKLESMSRSRQQAHAFLVAPDRNRGERDVDDQHERGIIRDDSGGVHSVRKSDFESLEKEGFDAHEKEILNQDSVQHENDRQSVALADQRKSENQQRSHDPGNEQSLLQSHRRRSEQRKASRDEQAKASEVLSKIEGIDIQHEEEVAKDSGKSSENESESVAYFDEESSSKKNSKHTSSEESDAESHDSASMKKKEEGESKSSGGGDEPQPAAEGGNVSKAAAESKESSAKYPKNEKLSDVASKDSNSASKQAKSSQDEGESHSQLGSAHNKGGKIVLSNASKAAAHDQEKKTGSSSSSRIKRLLEKAKKDKDDGNNNGERLTVNKYFDAVFVLNLERKPDRWFKTKARLARHGIHAEVIEGVDGYLPHHSEEFDAWIKSTPQTEDERQKGLRAYRSPGSWAHQFSCERAIKLAMERGYSNFLLLDDDILIHKDFETEFHEKIQLIDPDWKVLFLGASQYSWHDRAALFKNADDPFYTPLRTVGSFAVAFDQSTWQTMLDGVALREGAFDAFPMQRAILSNIDDSYCLYPNIITADVTESDTQIGKDQYNHSAIMRWRMEDMDMTPVADAALDWPLVSVVTTVRNAESTIEVALLSLLEQTYPNIECIVVDDKSSDSTVARVKQLQQFDDRIVLIENKVNIGTYPSRNVALEHARGEVIVIHDGDDVAVPNRIERQAQPILYGHARFTWGYCIRSHVAVTNFTTFFEQDALNWHHMDHQVQSARVHIQPNKDWAYCCREIIGLMTTAFHRSVFDEIGVFDATPFGGDAEFTERFLAHYTGEVIEPHDVINSYLLRNSALDNNLALRIEKPPLLWSIEKSESDEQNLSSQIPIKGEKRKAYREQYSRKLREMVKHRNIDK